MTLVLFFRLSNSVSLSCYFITENLSCGLVAVSTYPLFNTFVLTVLMMISKGYCILYKENNDRGVIAIATTLGTSYLFYSVSQIYSAFLNFLIFFYLFLFFYYSNSNTEEVLALLHEKSQIISLRSRDLRLIGIRIKRYKLFKKVIWVYLIFQSFVISIAFVFEVFDLGYTFFGWYLIEIVIESIRFFTVFIVYLAFNSQLQMNSEFFYIFELENPDILIVQALNMNYEGLYLPTVAVLPDQSLLVALPMNL